MSFILDALRRAETQRGYQPPQPSAEATLEGIAEPVVARPSGRSIATMTVAVAAMIAAYFFFTRPPEAVTPEPTPTRAIPMAEAAPLTGVGADTPLAEVAAPANRQVRPLYGEVSRPPAQQPATATTVQSGTVTLATEPLSAAANDVPPARTFSNIAQPATDQLPGYQELILSGRAQLPEFHLDIHVYAPAPANRFVFVNNRKYREGEKLDEGGSVERITPNGVVLNHRGHRFELLPD